MKEFELTLQIRNNRLKERRNQLGLNRRKIAEAIGIGEGDYGDYEALKKSPLHKKTGKWKVTALRIADYYRVTVEEIFPAAVREIKKANIAARFNKADAQVLLSSHQLYLLEANPSRDYDHKDLKIAVEKLLRTLTPKEKEVIERRFGLSGYEEQTLEEVGDVLGVQRERPRQIEAKALRKCKHPSRSKLIRSFVYND